MRVFKELVKRFGRDERGVFLALFAVMALVLIATTGAVVDFVTVQNARSEAQYALDAAALALQPKIYTSSEATLKGLADALVKERMTNASVDVEVDDAAIDTTNGALLLQAQLDVPLAFVSLVGVNDLSTRIASQATRKQLYLEVAFVLDNSGSMGSENRMTNLKSATKCATNIIFYGTVNSDCTVPPGSTKAENVKAAIVPFTSLVNIGSGNSGEPWMDQNGTSSIANDNFDNDDDHTTPMTDPVNRFDLFTKVGESWAGCVEARPYPYSVDDTAPDSSDPDTLFEPLFQPDEPDGWSNSYLDDTPNSCARKTGSCSCESHYESGHYGMGCGRHGRWGYCRGGWVTNCDKMDLDGTVVASGEHVCSCGYGSDSCDLFDYGNSLPDREKQERLCKYDGGSASFWGTRGPNGACPSNSILALTDNPSTVISHVNSMSANGYTNIQQGAIWGFRALSPGAPFTEGRAYDTAVSKIMILMTDGENTFTGSNNMNGSSQLQAYGHLYNAPVTGGTVGEQTDTRLGYTLDGKNDMPGIMNTLTEESCQNAKDAGINIYTIGLEPPNDETHDMLEACASSTSQAYFPNNSSELNDIFKEIANQLSPLRLAL